MGMESNFFSVAETFVSEKAEKLDIDNTPPDEVLPAIQVTATRMDTIREFLETPIHVNSWYRCLKLNRLLGSKDTSRHVIGEAVDWTSPKFGTPTEIAIALSVRMEDFQIDQLILEHTWVHTSFKSDKEAAPRHEIISLLADGSYAMGLTDAEGNKVNV